VVIEGNHDQSEGVSRYSWLRSFSQWRHLKLLEPAWDEGGKLRLEPWDDAQATGSYVDIGDARIFGSTWYGTTIGQTLPLLASAVREKRRDGATNIMMLHSDIEGQLNRPVQCALSISRLKELREAVDYLALGHTHKRFDIEGWAFNPGSLEACNVEEAGTERGAYLVETSGPQIKYEFFKAGSDYFQRPFRRLELQVDGKEEPEAIQADILELIRKECAAFSEVEEDNKPIIEVTLRGQLGFKNSLLKLDKLKERAMEQFRPLGLMINNRTVPRQLAVAAGLGNDSSPSAREIRIIEDLLRPDSRFGHRASQLAPVAIEIKRLTLEGETPERIYKLLEERFFQQSREPVEADPEPPLSTTERWPAEGPPPESDLLPFQEIHSRESAEAASADRSD
jgi:DNA repair exonuclease SbcCD nuclease subunit